MCSRTGPLPRSATCRPWSRPPRPRSAATSTSCMPPARCARSSAASPPPNWAAGWNRLTARPFDRKPDAAGGREEGHCRGRRRPGARRRLAHHPWRQHLLSLRPAAGPAQRAHLHQFHADGRGPLAEGLVPPDAWRRRSLPRAGHPPCQRRASAGILCLEILSGGAIHHPCRHVRVPPPDRARDRNAAAPAPTR